MCRFTILFQRPNKIAEYVIALKSIRREKGYRWSCLISVFKYAGFVCLFVCVVGCLLAFTEAEYV